MPIALSQALGPQVLLQLVLRVSCWRGDRVCGARMRPLVLSSRLDRKFSIDTCRPVNRAAAQASNLRLTDRQASRRGPKKVLLFPLSLAFELVLLAALSS